MEIQETSAVVSFFPLGRKGKGTIRVYKSPENNPVEIALQVEGTLIPHDAIKFSMGILQAVEYAIKLQKERETMENNLEIKFPIIKFNARYTKLFDVMTNDFVNTAVLLEVLVVKIENLSHVFMIIDTENDFNMFENKTGDYLLLIFKKSSFDTFFTLREYTTEKELFYRKEIGTNFKVEYENQ